MAEIPPGDGIGHDKQRSLPKPGTRIKAYGQYGRVMPYDHSHGTFPVRFDSGFWAVLGLDELDDDTPPARRGANNPDA